MGVRYAIPAQNPFRDLAPAPKLQPLGLRKLRAIKSLYIGLRAVEPGDVFQVDTFTAGDLIARGRASAI